MRRVFTIAIIALIVFLCLYGVVPPVKAAVDGFMLKTVGPTAFSTAGSLYTLVVSTVGVSGFSAIVLGFGFVVGIVAHFFWVKADWRLRRWGHSRTAKDLGATTTANVRSTPLGATDRPAKTTKPSTSTAEAPTEEEKQESEVA